MLIDTHVHLFPDKLCPKTIEKLAKTDPNHHLTYYGDGSLGCAEKNMKEWGVDLGVMLPIATNQHQQKSVNDFAAYVQNH
ncbi:amidohydrolase, partial [Eubacterium callanderi]|nr:amidohydrolase [Eubacterium callanderi]